jgi:Uncharacterized protein conserved in bacteria (DUF2252)
MNGPPPSQTAPLIDLSQRDAAANEGWSRLPLRSAEGEDESGRRGLSKPPEKVVTIKSPAGRRRPAPAEATPPSSAGSRSVFRSLADRMALGNALRDRVPRSDHGLWRKPAGRADPIDILQAADTDRLPELIPIRYGRMLASPFTFYRGSAGVMAADLASTPTTSIRVQACGDCHLLNFGGFATPERNIIFDINDFDETLPAPWEWDVKRLAASFVLAGRSNGLSDAKARQAAVTCARSYRKRLLEYSAMDPLSVWYARITADDFLVGAPAGIREDVGNRVRAATRDGADPDFPRLSHIVGGRLGIRDTPPLIFHPEVTRLPDFQARLAQILETYRETLADDRRVLLDRYQLVDAAIKVVGIGSVGRRCWVVLLMSAANDPLILQVKEAVASVMEPYAGKSVYSHHGERVVVGQRVSQPASDLFLGWLTSQDGTQYYVRRLRDAKIKPVIETMDAQRLDLYAKRCGWALARMHAKAGDACTISAYIGSGDKFYEAIGAFSVAYADQTERDHAALKAAVRRGRIKVYQET